MPTGDITGVTSIATPEYIDFNVTAPDAANADGRLYWNSDDNAKTLNLGMDGGNVIQQIGEDQYYRIKASSAITKGQVVMFTGTVGASGGLIGAPATGLTAATGAYVLGVAAEDILLNAWGYVQSFGEIRNLDTTGTSVGETWADGDILYYNPAFTGGLTKTIPVAPNAKIQVAAVVYANANGALFVRPTFEPRFNDLSDVYVLTPTDGDLVKWDNANSRWVNVTQSTITAGAATNVTVTATSTNATFYPAFVDATSGNNGVEVDSDLTYNPSTNTLAAGTVVATTGIFGGTF
jgi:hypothetical protein